MKEVQFPEHLDRTLFEFMKFHSRALGFFNRVLEVYREHEMLIGAGKHSRRSGRSRNELR